MISVLNSIALVLLDLTSSETLDIAGFNLINYLHVVCILDNGRYHPSDFRPSSIPHSLININHFEVQQQTLWKFNWFNHFRSLQRQRISKFLKQLRDNKNHLDYKVILLARFSGTIFFERYLGCYGVPVSKH